uniref:Hydroxymethylglutaryl-CoA synthase n=1 Tax=Panagrolaimus sp. ES5 TaxID=591445 RepID=A0AC34F593_9BILA
MAPENVGIHAVQTYFPRNYVKQEDLEKYDKAGEGKYTKGLGQLEMGFCYDNEDVNSLALTVTAGLLETYNIDRNSIGFLCVGTETLVDKSKSVKTQLMQLFGENTDIEGVDVKNACFGGTQALLHGIDWVYSNYEFDKRLAIVVMADIAVYEKGSARCTGGAGAIALLIGPNAPIVMERGLRSFHMSDKKDFYKPIGGAASEYPIVDGTLSLTVYFEAVDKCYSSYSQKSKKYINEDRTVNDFYSLLFHAPFYKMVQKAFGRLCFTDYERGSTTGLKNVEKLERLKSLSTDERYNRDFQQLTVASSNDLFHSKVNPNMQLNQRIGNMYTPSLYAQLVTLISRVEDLQSLNDQKMLLFSYGSGAASAMFSFIFKLDSEMAMKELQFMQQVSKAAIDLLDKRCLHTPNEYNDALTNREKLTAAEAAYIPLASQNGISQHLFPGAYYLTKIDEKKRRFYDRVPIQ